MTKEKKNKKIKFFALLLIYIIIIFIITFPLLLNINKFIAGFENTDESYAALWYNWRIKHAFHNHLSLIATDLIASPFGITIYKSKVICYLWLLYTHILSIITSPILVYNLQIIINLLLSGIFVYLLVYYLTDSGLCGFFSSLIFTFCPYQFSRIWQHLSLTYNQWIVVPILTAVYLKNNISKKSKILFFLSLLFLASFDFSVAYLGSIALAAFFIYNMIFIVLSRITKRNMYPRDNFSYIRRLVVISLFAGLVSLFQFLPIVKNVFRFSSTLPSAHNPFHRSFDDLFAQSAKPLSYLLPATAHPIFGKFTENFIGTEIYGDSFTEHTLYLGWVPLILAFVAARRWKKKRKESRKLGTVPFGDSPYKEDFYIGFFIFLAIVAWLFSQPPWWKIGSVKIYMPSFFMYKVLPMYRAYCRFGIVIMLAVAVLAGFGLKFILEKFKSQKTKIAITTLFCSLVLFEFWNWPPYKVIDVSKVPAVYYWLKSQPGDFAVAEYPLDADSPNEMYKFYQTKHEKKIINGTIPGTDANRFTQNIRNLSNPDTPSKLKWMGVKYVLVHSAGYLETELVEDREELERIPKNPGLKLIQAFPSQDCPQKNIMCVQKTGPIDVYEVK